MVEDQVKGAARNISGHIQDAVGGLTGDRSTQVKGMGQEAAGAAQYVYGKTVDSAKEAYGEVDRYLRTQPLAGVVAGICIGMVMGYFLNSTSVTVRRWR